MGGGPSALSCAYYLTLAGYKVTVIAKEAQPGGALLAQAGTDPKLNLAVMRDLQGVKAIGIGFEGQRSVMEMGSTRSLRITMPFICLKKVSHLLQILITPGLVATGRAQLINILAGLPVILVSL